MDSQLVTRVRKQSDEQTIHGGHTRHIMTQPSKRHSLIRFPNFIQQWTPLARVLNVKVHHSALGSDVSYYTRAQHTNFCTTFCSIIVYCGCLWQCVRGRRIEKERLMRFFCIPFTPVVARASRGLVVGARVCKKCAIRVDEAQPRQHGRHYFSYVFPLDYTAQRDFVMLLNSLLPHQDSRSKGLKSGNVNH